MTTKKPVKRTNKPVSKTRKATGKPKVIVTKEQVIEKLDNLFTLDEDEEINLDDFIENNGVSDNEVQEVLNYDKTETAFPKNGEDTLSLINENQSHNEDHAKNSETDNQEVKSFLKSLIKTGEIHGDINELMIKFNYFLLSRNMVFEDLTPQTIRRFVKIYEHYDIKAIRDELIKSR